MSLLRKSPSIAAVLAVLTYLGLPPMVRAMGFHPHADIPKVDPAGHRALIVTTSVTGTPDTTRPATHAVFEPGTRWREAFATHLVMGGNLVIGQTQNSGSKTAHPSFDLRRGAGQ